MLDSEFEWGFEVLDAWVKVCGGLGVEGVGD